MKEVPKEINDYITNRLNEYTLQLSEHLSQTVKGAVEVTVNGKIRTLSENFNAYVKEDEKWKERANPAVDFFVNVTWSKKFIVGTLLTVGAVFGALAAIRSYFMQH